MPVFSRTETLLACKFNQLGEIDPKGSKIYPPGSTSKDSVVVALPFFSVELSIQEKAEIEENIFFRTVYALREIKKNEGLEPEKIVDYIAEKTTLDRLVVKTIIRNLDQNTDRYTGTINKDPDGRSCYLIYDPIGKEYLFPCIPDNDYKDFKNVDVGSVRPNTKRHEVVFSLQMSNHAERALFLGFDKGMDSWDQYAELSAPEHVPARTIEEIKSFLEHSSYGRGKHFEVKEVGNWNPIMFLCNCHVDPNDLSGISVRSIASNKYSLSLFEMIRETALHNPDSNQELISALQDLEDNRQYILNNASLFIDEQKDAQLWVLSRYPDLSLYEDVKKKVSTFIARFPKEKAASKDDVINQSKEWSDSQKEDITRDFHTAMETVFAEAVKKCYPVSSDKKVQDAFTVLKPSRKDYSNYFVPMAKEIGFTDMEACEKFFATSAVRQRDIKEILTEANPQNVSEKKRKQYGLSELIIAMMIEANSDESHPFRKIAPKCPNLFEAMKTSKTRRDRIKHKDDEKLPVSSVEELFKMRALLEICLELVAKRATKEEEIKAENDLNGQYAARIKADEQVKSLVGLNSFEGTRQAAWSSSYRFHYQDPEYFSECYNLMDKLLNELLNRYDCPNGEALIEQVFGGKRDGSDWVEVQKLFEKHGFEYLKDLPPPSTADLVRDKRQMKKWSIRNKLGVVFVTFDHDQPDVLKKIHELYPEIVLDTDEIHKSRGHSNSAEFQESADGFRTFYTRLLTGCENIAKMILEVK